MAVPAYNPGLMSPEELEYLFVVRHAELAVLETVLDDFATGESRQHAYVVGQRGMGKTTLLLRLCHRCGEDGRWPSLVPAMVAEESYGVGDLADFWILLATSCAEVLGPSLMERVQALEVALASDADRLAESVLAEIKRAVRETSGRLVVFVDNFDEILEKVAEDSAHRLREELQENPNILLIAASSRAAQATYDYRAPFYDFFRVLTLQPLEIEEVRALLVVDDSADTSARVERTLGRRPERVHGILRLTGGNPRLVVLARRLVRDSPLAGVHDDLRGLLDDVTPYYKHLVDDLPAQCQRVFHALASRWEPAAAGDLETPLRLPRNQISAQLSRLSRDGWIQEVPEAPGRGTTYRVASRLFNLFYLMRFRRSERERLRWWVVFVESFYGRDEGHRSVIPYLREVETTDGPTRVDLLREAIDSTWCMSEPRSAQRARSLILSTALDTGAVDAVEAILSSLPPAHRESAASSPPARLDSVRRMILDASRPDDGSWNAEEFDDLVRQCVSISVETKEAIARGIASVSEDQVVELRSVLQRELRALSAAMDPELLERWRTACGSGRLGATNDVGEQASALDGLVFDGVDCDPRDRSLLAFLWGSDGQQASEEGRAEDAEMAFRRAIESDPADARLWNNLGYLLENHLARHDEAEAAFRRAIELNPEEAPQWNNLGNLLKNHLARYDEAEAAYRRAIESDPAEATPWFNLGCLLANHMVRFDDAEAAYRRAIELDPAEVKARNNLGRLLQDHLARYDDAEAAYRHAIKADPEEAYPWYNLGDLLQDRLTRYDEAEAAYQRGIELGPPDAKAWNNLGSLLETHMARFNEAEDAYRRAIEIDPNDAKPRRNLAALLDRLGRTSEVEQALRGLVEVDSHSHSALNSLAWHLVCHANSPAKWSEATSLAGEAASAAPEDAAIRHTLATALLGAGEEERAIEAAKRYYRDADAEHLEHSGGDAIALAVRLCQAGRKAEVLDAIRESPVPGFWAPVELALRMRTTDDRSLMAAAPLEIADSAREFLARVDGEESDAE